MNVASFKSFKFLFTPTASVHVGLSRAVESVGVYGGGSVLEGLRFTLTLYSVFSMYSICSHYVISMYFLYSRYLLGLFLVFI